MGRNVSFYCSCAILKGKNKDVIVTVQRGIALWRQTIASAERMVLFYGSLIDCTPKAEGIIRRRDGMISRLTVARADMFFSVRHRW